MALPPEIKKKMNNLDKRIDSARKDYQEEYIDNTHEDGSPEEEKSSRAGSEFLANVLAGALIGYGVDWAFSTTPWGMMFFIIIGFISAVLRANAAMKSENKETSKKSSE